MRSVHFRRWLVNMEEFEIKPRSKRLSGEERLQSTRESKRKYKRGIHSVSMSNAAWNRWTNVKTASKLRSNDEVASHLLDTWELAQMSGHVEPMAGTSTADPSTPPRPLQSTPAHFRPIKELEAIVSDISGPEDPGSELSGVEQISLVEKYEKKAKFAEGSFIKKIISYDVEVPEHDVSYHPTFSEEEEAYDDDDEESDEEYGYDFDLDMSLRQEVSENLDDLPVLTPGEAILGVEDEETAPDTDVDEAEHTDVGTRDLVREPKAICFRDNLIDLAQMKVGGQCNRKGCDGITGHSVKMIGTSCKITWKCSNDHIVKTWNSQPKVKKRMAGDVLMSSSIICSGNNYEKVRLMMKFFGMGITAKTTHYQLQSKHCVPVIKAEFDIMMQRNLQKYQGETVTVAGDGRMDSPGHCAQYCTYTIMEYESKDILACEIVNKRETDMKSTLMEKEGLKRAMQKLLDSDVHIKELCTDASTSISSFIAKEHSTMKHSFDTWHGAKNFGKKLASVAAETKNKELRPWVPDIINHFWYCSLNANGDEDTILAKWRGLLHHVVDVHEWISGDGAIEAKCAHGELAQDGETKWLEPGEKAHMALTKIVLDTRLLHNLNFYVNFRHTGELETFHEHILMYCAKRFAYTYPVYKARNYLACLDYQHHINRPVLTTKKGEKRLHRVYSKRNNNWSSHEEKVPKKYEYMPDLLTTMLNHFIESEEKLTSPVQLTPSDPRKFKRTLSKDSPPPTKMLMEAKKSRFGDKK